MKKFSYLILSILFFCLVLPARAAGGKADIYFFYGQGCPHCANEEILLDKNGKEFTDVAIHRYEVWHNAQNADFLSRLSSDKGWNVQGVPFTVIGNKTITGYLDENSTGQEILGAIAVCQTAGCPDVVGDYIKGIQTAGGDTEVQNIEKVSLPLFGQLDLKKVSLPILTIAIAAVDGLNPCALWVLLFLISLLISMQEKKKLLILGSAFILASGALYYLVLAAWLNFLLFVGFIKWMQIALGVAAVYSGYYYIKKWYDQDKACHSVDEEKRKKLFDRVKAIVARDQIWLALAGIIVVAVSVNLFKLLCSAGLPAVYTQVLALSGVPRWQYYAYLFLYVLVFEIYEIVILGIALSTFKMKAINPKIVLRVGLAGGIVMLIIGLLLIFKPTWLMFG